jgi:hypothetical protein
MDADIVFASDCDIKFALGAKVKAKIMDFSLRGLIRIVFKPIVNEIPLIGGVQVRRPQVFNHQFIFIDICCCRFLPFCTRLQISVCF